MTNKLVFMAFFLILIILMTLQGYSGATKGKDNEGPCAACKYRRRSCPADCMFRRHFPGNRPQDFRKFHRLFGVQHTITELEKLDPDKRDDALTSLKVQSLIRAIYPVGGCAQLIRNLLYQIDLVTAESHLIRNQTANFFPPSDLAAATFNPDAAVFHPTATGFNPDAAVFNPPSSVFSSSSAAESSSSELRNLCTNITVNDYYFTGVPVGDSTIDLFTGGNLGDMETRPLERSSVQLYLPNPVADVFNPAAATDFISDADISGSFSAAESSSSELRNPSTNLTVDDYFTGVPIGDGTIDLLSGGGHCGNFGDMETRPLERSSVQLYLPNPNNLGSCSAAAANNANSNYENAIDSDSDFDDEFDAFLGVSPPNQIQLNNDDIQSLFDDNDLIITDDWLRSFFQTKESGDKCPESKTKDDEE